MKIAIATIKGNALSQKQPFPRLGKIKVKLSTPMARYLISCTIDSMPPFRPPSFQCLFELNYEVNSLQPWRQLHNITQLLGYVLWDHVSHAKNILLYFRYSPFMGST